MFHILKASNLITLIPLGILTVLLMLLLGLLAFLKLKLKKLLDENDYLKSHIISTRNDENPYYGEDNF